MRQMIFPMLSFASVSPPCGAGNFATINKKRLFSFFLGFKEVGALGHGSGVSCMLRISSSWMLGDGDGWYLTTEEGRFAGFHASL